MPQYATRGAVPRSLPPELEKHGWTKAARATITVVHTPRATLVPEVAGAWLWVCDERVSVPMMQAAVDGGALDVVVTNGNWQRRVAERLEESLVAEPALPPVKDFVAESAAAKSLLRKLYQAAQTSMPVLLTGETGTGKELASRLIHEWSPRAKRTFVPINCAAIPNELMEGELFGYVRGAFSGATRDYDGQLAAGEGGTVFLDEIDDTPLVLQNKLLRVLEDRVISRLGESVWTQVDFRLVAATNRDLKQLIAQGQFGDDLYERLATVQVVLPPLRERLNDLPSLVMQLIGRLTREDPVVARRLKITEVTSEAIDVLRAYSWPGNIRELRNVVFGALANKRAGHTLLVSDLPRRLWAKERGHEADGLLNLRALEARVAGGAMNLKRELEQFERAAVEAALRHAGGNAAEAARLLGEVGRGSAKDPGGTLRTMIKRLGLAHATS